MFKQQDEVDGNRQQLFSIKDEIRNKEGMLK